MQYTDIGIDLGTASILVYIRGKGVVLKEPSVVAFDRDTNKIKAIGEDARLMLGRTPGNIVAVRPLRQGVISDYTVTEKMMKYFIQKALGRKTFRRPRIAVCVPSGVTEVEKKAVEDATYQAGAREVSIIEEPIAAAIGAGIDISRPCGNMIVDIGGGTQSPFMVFYFMDRTDVEVAVKECTEARPVFGIIRIDNVSEVTADMTDMEKSALLSDVTERVLSYFSSRDGFIKQYSTTDFVTCISQKALADMMEENFDILDRVREIHTVNRIPVTLSIGVVQSEDSFARQFEEDQVSLDLALGRGGDQAIVRIGKDVRAFGGKSPTAVSSTRRKSSTAPIWCSSWAMPTKTSMPWALPWAYPIWPGLPIRKPISSFRKKGIPAAKWWKPSREAAWRKGSSSTKVRPKAW